MYPTSAINLEQIWHGHLVQRQFFNLFLNNSSEHEFFKTKRKFSHDWFDLPINNGVEHAIISRHISSKNIEVPEVVSILPQMENAIHISEE